MSRFSGPQYRGAARDAHSRRRTEAQDRQARFDAEVAKVARDQNCMTATAYDIVSGRRRFEMRLAAKAGAR